MDNYLGNLENLDIDLRYLGNPGKLDTYLGSPENVENLYIHLGNLGGLQFDLGYLSQQDRRTTPR